MIIFLAKSCDTFVYNAKKETKVHYFIFQKSICIPSSIYQHFLFSFLCLLALFFFFNLLNFGVKTTITFKNATKRLLHDSFFINIIFISVFFLHQNFFLLFFSSIIRSDLKKRNFFYKWADVIEVDCVSDFFYVFYFWWVSIFH